MACKNAALSPLYNGLWTIDFCQLSHNYNAPVWLNRTQLNWRVGNEEDEAFLDAHDVFIDWGGCDNGNMINLFAQHQTLKTKKLATQKPETRQFSIKKQKTAHG